MKNIFIQILAFFLLLGASIGQAGTTVSDSLVENLDCRRLSPTEITRKIRPEAFSSSYHLPVKNWGFSAGPYDLAACWSLARSQRLLFYLTRWGDTPAPDLDKTTFDLLEVLRGTSPYAHIDDTQIKEFPLRELVVFQQRETTWNPSSFIWLSLNKGFTQSFPNDQKLKRNFRSEIEFYQNRRFHDFIRNIRYIIGNGTRSSEKNRATRDQILRNIEDNRLTLILLRPKRVSQHVVVAKKYKLTSNGNIEIYVYDPNTPDRDQILTFHKTDENFYAPDIVRGLPEIEDPQAPIGIFVVDENEHKVIDRTLMTYYQKKCLSVSPGGI